jgi:hypothetical protein
MGFNKVKSLVIVIFVFSLNSCNTQKNISGYYSFETECLGVELDGSQTLRSWGKGKNKRDAIVQAKKNAVRDVLFKGISKGSKECDLKPVLIEVNAKEIHQDYFFSFFKDGGKYSKYTSNKDGSVKNKFKSNNEFIIETTVRVLRSKLKEQLIKDNIIK